MSLKLFGIVLDDLNEGLAPSAKLILMALASFADSDGRGVMPSRRKLAEIALCSLNEVRKVVDRYVERGVLLIDGPGSAWGRTRRFRLNIARAHELHAGDTPLAAADVDGVERGDRASGGADDAPAVAGEGKPAPSLACARWRAYEGALRDELGEDTWTTWLRILIPESDDGAVLVLAVSTAAFRDVVRARYVETIERIIGRRVELVVRAWAAAAARNNRRDATEDN